MRNTATSHPHCQENGRLGLLRWLKLRVNVFKKLLQSLNSLRNSRSEDRPELAWWPSRKSLEAAPRPAKPGLKTPYYARPLS